MDRIGRYRIIGELGRGAMGVVYHATDPAIGRPVAIKTIRIHDIDDAQKREKLRERLFREARSAGVLSHPNIVTIYDMDEVDDLAYIAMAYVNGPTLERILATDQPLSGSKMLRILRQTALGLDYAHTKGIVHRDVKPANIMTDEDGSVKITDFGIARITAGVGSTETKTIAGTPNYMSPEQVQGSAVDGRSDQFSLAVIAYEILTGERPFVGEHLSTIVFKIVAEDPPAANRLNATLTPQIDEVLRKGLAKKPENRFPNCSNFVGALELACAESRGWKTLPAGAAAAMPTLAVERMPQIPVVPQNIVGETARPPEEPTQAPARRARFWPLVLSALLVGGLAAFFVYQHAPADQSPVEQPVPQAPAAEPEPAPAVTQPEVKKPSPVAVPETPPGTTPPEQAPPVLTIPDAPVAQGRMQSVWVTTNPPGAKAVLDGNLEQACQAPCMLHGVPGVHHLTISQAGYLNEYREVRVGDTAVDVPQIVLRQPTTTLMVSSDPSGASIRVNGELKPQVTPAVLYLKPGSYSVTVERNGVSKTQRVELGDNLVHLSVTLGQ
jgi:tRNA A-37 threonylcarbamoyl transferase component Bud32